ncbi:MAG: MFS transporter [Pseudomonadota bacterium]
MGYVAFLRQNAAFLTAGLLLTFTSSYGQTYFISLFAGDIKAAFSLTDGQWGGIYTLGTTLSAIAMVWAGVLTDAFRIRSLAFVIMLGLAAACMAMAMNTSWVALILIVLALRFTGQGMLSQLGSVAMVRWFEASRGKALSISSMGFALGQAVLPIIFVALFTVMSWRSLWALAALLVLLTIPLLIRLLRLERTPQSMADEMNVTGMDTEHWTRRKMLRSGLFYLMLPTVIGPATWGTALFFHQVHLTETKSWDLISYVALMPVYTLAAVVTTFLSGWAIDRFGVSRLIPLQMVPFALAFLVLALTQTIWGAGLGLILFGVGQGILATSTTSFWAAYYGTGHIGAIKALSTALMVFGSAIGPGITGALIDVGIDFETQMIPIAVFYLFAGGLAAYGVFRNQRRLPS